MPMFEDEDEFKIKNPQVREYLASKFSPEARQKLVDQNSQDASGPNWLAGLAALGSGLQGGNAAQAGQQFLQNQNSQRDRKLVDFDSGRKLAMEEDTMAGDREKVARESDPSSEESKLAQQMAIDLGVKPALVGKLTAAKLKEQLPMLKQKYDIDQRKLDRSEARADRLQLASANRGGALTEGQKSVDKGYAKQYNDFTSKGRVNSTAAIDRLESLAGEMEGDQGLGEAGGGRLGSILPDVLRSRDAVRRRDSTRNAANTTLKELFGGQLSDGEREAAAKEYYNDALDNKTNAKLLRDKIEQLKGGLASETAKADFYEKNGSLQGFKGVGATQVAEESSEAGADKRRSRIAELKAKMAARVAR